MNNLPGIPANCPQKFCCRFQNSASRSPLIVSPETIENDWTAPRKLGYTSNLRAVEGCVAHVVSAGSAPAGRDKSTAKSRGAIDEEGDTDLFDGRTRSVRFCCY
ncbi:hypothetical protein [Tahibacter amnicola]|uniref:Uncharacterized protein n=1 Tax=Tahibacter amnicola TaxID=2976241 RepID=A0ABY6BN70_9GAMM|nr:hypothetical protein [Tahibacter amnicola]UXI70505.1 hypothetical protein N4264_12965 [Tahibacter amnicola]